MKLNDGQLRAVAEYNVFNQKARWNLSRGMFNFVVAVTPLVVCMMIAPVLPGSVQPYVFIPSGAVAFVIVAYNSNRMSKLTKAEYERIKHENSL